MTKQKTKPSIWKQGFWISLIFCAFYVIGSDAFSFVTLIIGFFFWWGLGALAVRIFRFFDRER